MRSSAAGCNNSWRTAMDAPHMSSQHQSHQHQAPLTPGSGVNAASLQVSGIDGSLAAAGGLASLTTGQLVQGTNGDIYIMVTPSAASAAAAAAAAAVATSSNTSTSTIASHHQQHSQQQGSGSSVRRVVYSKQQQQLHPATEGERHHRGSNGASVITACCDREKRRKSSHNEVERRRRDKINALINQLAEMMPRSEWEAGHAAAGGSGEPSPSGSPQQQMQTPIQQQQQAPWLCMPKSVVLKKAVDYFSQVQVQNCHLVQESEALLMRAEELSGQVEQLELENARLKAQLGSAGLTMKCE